MLCCHIKITIPADETSSVQCVSTVLLMGTSTFSAISFYYDINLANYKTLNM